MKNIGFTQSSRFWDDRERTNIIVNFCKKWNSGWLEIGGLKAVLVDSPVGQIGWSVSDNILELLNLSKYQGAYLRSSPQEKQRRIKRCQYILQEDLLSGILEVI